MSKRDYSQTFGVAGAVIEKEGKILLVKETKNIAKDMWSLPAGWIEMGENPFDAVAREVKEETGYNFKPSHLLGIVSLYKPNLKEKFNITPHSIKIIFVGDISEEKADKLADDISEVKWFSPEQIYKMDNSKLRDIAIKKLVRDYFEGKRYPLELLSHIVSK